MSDYNIPVSGGVNGLNVPLHGHIAVYNKEFPVIPNPEGEVTGYVTKLGFTPKILQVKDPEVHDWARAEEKPTYTKAEVGLENVDNTSDLDKPISMATQTALDGKVDAETGKGLSTNDYNDEDKDKLNNIEPNAEVNVQSDFAQTDDSADDFIKNKPTKLSDFLNDTGFITSTVDNLTYYYKKSETYTQAEVNALIGSIVTISFLVVQTLPQTGETNIIYLVPADEPNPDNIYEEYIYVNSNWEMIGTTKVDLSNYYTKTETDTLLNGKVDKDGDKVLSDNNYSDNDKAKLGEIDKINEEAFEFNEVPFEQGYWAISNGVPATSNSWIRTKENLPENTREVQIDTSTNIVAFVLAYDVTGYKGCWNGSAWTTTYNERDGKQFYNIEQIRSAYPTYRFRLSVHRTNSSPISVSDAIYISETYVYPSVIQATQTAEDLSVITKWQRGVVSANGNVTSENGATTEVLYDVSKVSLSTNCRAVILLYRDSYYLGKLNSNGGIDKASGNWKYFYNDIDIGSILKTLKADGIVVSVLPTDNYEITPENVTTYGDSHFKAKTINLGEIAYKKARKLSLLDRVSNSVIMSINHRGFNRVAPENTISAFMLSKINGFDYVECDVWFTSDNVPVILHDSTINRTARNADGSEIEETIEISNITYAQALEYDFGIWKGEEWKETKIPTFEEFLILCKKISLNPVVELKDWNWNNSKTQSIADTIKKIGMEKACSFISFTKSALVGISALFPTAILGLGYSGDYSVESITTSIISAEDLLLDNNKVYLIIDNYGMTQADYDLFLTSDIDLMLVGLNSADKIVSLDKSVNGVLSDNLNASEVLALQTLFTLM